METLGNVCQFLNGGTPSKAVPSYFEGDILWITSADIVGPITDTARSFITEEAVKQSATNKVPAGTVLLVTRTGVGKVTIAGKELCFSQDITAIIPDSKLLDAGYLVQYLRTKQAYFERLARGATIKGITRDVVTDLPIPLPPLPEQRRIAAILDQADALRAKRREALAQLDSLTQSIFIEMFGDPATNPRNWPWTALGSIASKFSDGPFGSNLKSEHYLETGVRVVRLQNIGVGEFIDNDKAYISERHFESIKKHECRPGDVLVGTMGDPNLRACILPDSIPLAINKADCVQIRVDANKANSNFICSLLNHSSTELLAQYLKHGQTRVRISMGSLRGLDVPIPPINLQNEFDARLEKVLGLRTSHVKLLNELDALFDSLQHRAFRGEL